MLNGGGDLTRRPFVGLTVKTWPEALRFCRVERGFSFRELKDKVKVPPERIRGWEYGQGEPDRSKLRLLYQALPKLRNYAHLLPETLSHAPAHEPTGEPAAPEVAAEAVKARAAEAERPSRMPDPASYKTFAEALLNLIKIEGLTHKEFGALALCSQSTISRYTRVPNTGMLQATYDRIVSLLPDIARAPKPPISEKNWIAPPGRKGKNSAEIDRLARLKAGGAAADTNAEKLERVRAEPAATLPAAPRRLPPPPVARAVPPPPVAPTQAADPFVARILAPPAPAPVDLVKDPDEVAKLTDELNGYGAAYGVACATVVRLRHSLQLAEAQIKEYHEKIRATAARLGVITE